MTRVVFAGNLNTERSRRVYFWLCNQCAVYYHECQNEKIPWDELGAYDLGISFLYEHKVPANHCQKFVNFHPAPLPEFGGRNLAYHAIMENAKQFGATLHYMAENYDEGPLIEVQRFTIEPWMTAGDLVQESHNRLDQMFYAWVPELLKGKVPSFPQDNSKAKYYKKEPIDNFVDNHVQDRDVCIRALTCPPHYAKIEINGKVYKIVPE